MTLDLIVYRQSTTATGQVDTVQGFTTLLLDLVDGHWQVTGTLPADRQRPVRAGRGCSLDSVRGDLLMRRLIGALLVSLTAAVLLVVAAPAAGAAEPTGDPSADDYSPWVWINAWGNASARDEARAGDATEGLQHSGMVVAAVPDQLNALTAADKAQLDTAWHGSGLLAAHLCSERSTWADEGFPGGGFITAGAGVVGGGFGFGGR